jgi:hypothetical protein
VTWPGPHERLKPPQGTDDIPHGTLVHDLATGRVGILMHVITYAIGARTDTNAPRPKERLAYLRAPGGGRERTTSPNRIQPEPAGGAS